MLTEQQNTELEAIAAITEYVTDQEVIDKSGVEEIEKHLDKILASVEKQHCFFKRLL